MCGYFFRSIAATRLCPDCRGTRLRAEARAVLIEGRNICEVSALTITAATEFFDALNLSPSQMEIAGKVLEEVRQRTSASCSRWGSIT